MIGLLVDIWPCVAAAALMGVGAGWLVWGRDTKKIVESYRGRLAKARANWETVEERLAQALAHASALEREKDAFQRTWTGNQVMLQEKEESWKQERRLLEETLRQLNHRLLVLESAPPPQPSSSSRSKRDLGQ